MDQHDFGQFQICLTGPGMAETDQSCEVATFDGDMDVDQDDFVLFERCFSGPGVPGDPNCARQT